MFRQVARLSRNDWPRANSCNSGNAMEWYGTTGMVLLQYIVGYPTILVPVTIGTGTLSHIVATTKCTEEDIGARKFGK
eukprot:scaffold4707_cov164-Amphora_coffeaeformis.AAC.29